MATRRGWCLPPGRREMGLAEAGQAILLLAGFGKNEPQVTVLTA
jgi:hypothetical protein